MSRLTPFHRLASAWWLTAAISTLCVLAVVNLRPTERLDHILYDATQRLNTRPPNDRVMLVAIDNASLGEFGRWPWSRDLHAKLIENLAAARPQAIIYDVLFVERSRDDASLAAALAKAGNVRLPYLLEGSPDTDVRRPVLPIADMRAAAAGIGHVNLIKDGDGVVRSVRYIEQDSTSSYPHLVLGSFLSAADRANIVPGRPYLIPFAGAPATFPTVSAAAVLRGQVPARSLRGRILIVGATAEGLGDYHNSLFASSRGLMTGIELQANMVDSLLGGYRIHEASPLVRNLFALVPLWLMLLGFRLLRPGLTLPGLAVLALLVVVTSFLTLRGFGIWLSPVIALAGLVIAYPLWAWRRLTAVSAYMVGELEGLRTDANPTSPFGADNALDDPIMREAGLLSDAVHQIRAMRHFVSESLEQLPDAVFVVDEQGRVRLLNHRARRLLDPVDSSQADIAGLFAGLNAIPPTAAPLWPPSADEVAREVSGQDGRYHDVRITRYRNRGQAFSGWIVRLSDVSEIRLAQRQRDEMLDFLTHDMRAPQTSILALTAAADPSEIQPALAARIDRYARRTLGLADGLVHLERARMLRFEPVTLDLAALLVEALDELWPQIRRRGVTVRKEGLDDEYLVAGERTLLSRALINLLENAIKYGRENGTIDCRIERRRGPDGLEVECQISDDGQGLSEDKLQNLFGRFERGGHSTGQDGAGLGLRIVEVVIARHQGTVTVSSDPGRGTTFTLTFPLVRDSSDQ